MQLPKKPTDDKYEYFPHRNVREEQIRIIEPLYEFLRSDSRGLILSADPGIGKEACMTSQCLKAMADGLYDRAFFVVPTGSGKINTMKELEAVKHDLKVLDIKSKDILCQWIKDSEDERISPMKGEKCGFDLCKSFRQDCPYNDGNCPYYLQKKEVPDSDIIVCDYNYIFSPFVRKAYGIDDLLEKSERTLLFVNECHKLPARMETIYSKSISSATIGRAINELDEYGFADEKILVTRMQDGLGDMLAYRKAEMEANIKEYGLDISTKKVSSEMFADICNNSGSVLKAGNSIKKDKFEGKKGIISYAEYVGNFMERFNSTKKYSKNYIYFIKLKNDLETGYLGWTPLYIGGLARAALEKFDKFVLYSGTCFPDKFKYTVGLQDKNLKIETPEKIESPFLKNRKDIVLTNSVFKARNRKDKKFLKRVKTEIKLLAGSLPKPAAIVCTTGWFRCLDLKLPILTEPETPEEVDEWLTEKAADAEFIYFSPYGRVAQSVDMSFLKSVFFIGYPQKSYDDISIERAGRLEKDLKGKHGSPKYVANYMQFVLPTYESVIQSAMRGLRTENDKLTVLFLDKRYERYKGLLNSKNMSICSKTADAIRLIIEG